MRNDVHTLGIFLLLAAIHSPWCCCAESRAEQWIKLRQEKMKVLVPNRLSTSERILYRVEKGTLGLSYKGFYPSIASVATGAGFGGQLRYWKQSFLTSSMDFQILGAYTTRSYQVYNLQLGKIMKKGVEPLMGSGGSGGFSDFHGLGKRRPQDFFLYVDLRYRYFPQEDYFGPGPDSSKEDRTDYLMEVTSGALVAGYKLGRYALVAGLANYQRNEVRPGTDPRYPNTQNVFDDSAAPGLDSQPDFLSFSGAFVLDYRDRPGNPHRGGMLGFQITRYNDRGGENFEFSRYTVDARQYLPLGSEQRILALRFLTSFENPDHEARVPFYLQETLGGGEILRGYDNYRFRDLNMLYLSGEYRWEAAPALEFALFYDAGKVFPEPSDFSFNRLRDSYGFGVRFKLPQATFLRVDTAHSNEGTRVYLKFGLAAF